MKPIVGVIIEPYKSVLAQPMAHRFPALLKLARDDAQLRLPLFDTGPVHVAGSSAPELVYGLAHGSVPPTVDAISPSMWRQLRGLAHELRLTGGSVHVFGMLDNHSPFGTRRTTELLVRSLSKLDIPVTVHLGVWHPTPNEFQLGWQELQSLPTVGGTGVVIGSIFPVSAFLHHDTKTTRTYLDGIFGREQVNQPHDIVLPLHAPVVLHPAPLEQEDVILVANHSLHGLDQLASALSHHYGHRAHVLDFHHPTSPRILNQLKRKKHVMSVSNSPSNHEAYFGTSLTDPYYESVAHESAVELLEMLISPHFGYHVAPHTTMLLLRQPQQADFDTLLGHYLKKIKAEGQDYYCVVLDPTDLHGSWCATNLPLQTGPSLRAQLEAYV